MSDPRKTRPVEKSSKVPKENDIPIQIKREPINQSTPSKVPFILAQPPKPGGKPLAMVKPNNSFNGEIPTVEKETNLLDILSASQVVLKKIKSRKRQIESIKPHWTKGNIGRKNSPRSIMRLRTGDLSNKTNQEFNFRQKTYKIKKHDIFIGKNTVLL